MLTTGKLNEHLAKVEEKAASRRETLIQQMAKVQGVTDQLKSERQMERIGLMNNIRTCADEIVLSELIYI